MAAFIKFDGIDGESLDDKHKKWIDLESMSQMVHKPGEGASGTARRRGSIMMEDVQCSKLVDKSTPKLQDAVCQGKIFPKVEIEFTTTTTGDSRQTYLRYELKNVMVTSHSLNGSSQGKPMEQFSLNFEGIKVEYTEMDEAGTKKGNVAYGWDVPAAKKA